MTDQRPVKTVCLLVNHHHGLSIPVANSSARLTRRSPAPRGTGRQSDPYRAVFWQHLWRASTTSSLMSMGISLGKGYSTPENHHANRRAHYRGASTRCSSSLLYLMPDSLCKSSTSDILARIIRLMEFLISSIRLCCVFGLGLSCSGFGVTWHLLGPRSMSPARENGLPISSGSRQTRFSTG